MKLGFEEKPLSFDPALLVLEISDEAAKIAKDTKKRKSAHFKALLNRKGHFFNRNGLPMIIAQMLAKGKINITDQSNGATVATREVLEGIQKHYPRKRGVVDPVGNVSYGSVSLALKKVARVYGLTWRRPYAGMSASNLR